MNFFSEEDVKKGFFYAFDRASNQKKYKLTSLSIAGLIGSFKDLNHSAISKELSLIKKESKSIIGSSLVFKEIDSKCSTPTFKYSMHYTQCTV